MDFRDRPSIRYGDQEMVVNVYSDPHNDDEEFVGFIGLRTILMSKK